MRNETPYCYLRCVYDETQIYRTLNRIKEGFKNQTPNAILSSYNEDRSLIYAVYEDDSQENLLVQDLIDLGLIKLTKFNDFELEQYAEAKMAQETPPQLWSFGVFDQEINGKICRVTGSMPVRPLTKEEIIDEHKKLNKYSWV